MKTKVYSIRTEENIDGEIQFDYKLFYKKEDAIKHFNDEIKDFKNDDMVKRNYEPEDIEDAEYTENEHFFCQASCDDFYYQLDLEEKEIN